MKVKRWTGGGRAGLNFWCPGCRDVHSIVTEGAGAWGYNGDPERPVFTPSVLVTGLRTERDDQGRWTGEYERDAKGEPLPLRCHTFVGCNGAAPGQIVFLSDCTHGLAGKTVDLPDWTSRHDPCRLQNPQA